MFKAVKPEVDIQKLEREQLDFWRLNRVFQRSMEERQGAPRYVTYEGPPTVNGTPGVHHVLARAFKDIFPRYKTMRGYYALRKGGWDTHGLPVELALEKELGFTQKRQIEEFGIAEFNRRCRDSVLRNISKWETFTERMAYWTNLDDAYVTFTNDYIESVWWILKQFWEKDLLYKGLKVVPYCARCGTPLSSHEVSQGYEDVEDPSVFVRFPLRDKPGVYFLVWTTTPWTLPANVALAVGADLDYVQLEGPVQGGDGTENLIMAAALVDKVLVHREEYKVVKKFKGKDLLGMQYNPLYTFLPVETKYAYVVAGDFVSTDDGTGIVHIAPAFGVDDMAVGKENNLPVLQTVGADGKFIDAVTEWRGVWVKDADPEITRDLKRRGLLYKQARYTHTYPFCWRCGTPLLYYAKPSWYIRTTAKKDRLLANNAQIDWVPEHIRAGRFGNWLENNIDWAISRERYWGTPLPLWVSEDGQHIECIGSLAELEAKTGQSHRELDLHRPYVDEVTWVDPQHGLMRRIPDVADCWFDSGAMPVAQWHYPFENQELFAQAGQANYISEAIDQTRGWFYTLHALSTLLFDRPAFQHVIALGILAGADGRRMSKSRGTAVDPSGLLETYGADAVRWYMYASAPPYNSRVFLPEHVGEPKKLMLTLWNTTSFFVTYANLAGWKPQQSAAGSQRPEAHGAKTADGRLATAHPLDCWALARLHALVRDVTAAFERYDIHTPAKLIEAFVDELSNWYVRRSRRRFWQGEPAALATLYECLTTLSRLLAPFMPFLSEQLYQTLVAEQNEGVAQSVHLAAWPAADQALI
ncbi:MAG: isoleucine--tRNA ligase, partial [Anaerolineae bacterium]|nr:isoleucine--tRNA ligase [Anaerolineae bacterium]